MVLTPDQKRRIAELDSKAPVEEQKSESQAGPPLSAKVKSLWLKFRVASWRPLAFRLLIAAVIIAVAMHYIQSYQLHKLDFRKIISSRDGNPIGGLVEAVKEQKKKADMLDEAQAQFLGGDYEESLATADAVARMDARDHRAQDIIDVTTDAAVQRASRELDMGEIEAALADARLALKYRPEHQEGQQLCLRIGESLLREAQVHYSKKEYAQAIKKAKEVVRINPSDMDASNLLMRTNSDLLAQAEGLFFNKRYFDALEKVRLSLLIDPTNPASVGLLDKISLYVETPDIKLRGITRIGSVPYAIIQLPGSSQTIYLKKGESVQNFKLVDIQPAQSTATFMQIYSKAQFTVGLSKPE